MKKILCFSDLHGDQDRLQQLIKILDTGKYDTCFICGDITNFGSREQAEQILASLSRIRTTQFFCVHGNCDTPDAIQALQQTGHYIHLQNRQQDDFAILGYGNVPPTPFGTHNEIPEPQIEKELQILLDDVQQLSSKRYIFISHCPPYSINDLTPSGLNAGSTSIKTFIEKLRPEIMLHGHIHEATGMSIYDYENKKIVAHYGYSSSTIRSKFNKDQGAIINVASARNARCAVLEIENDLFSLEFRELS